MLFNIYYTHSEFVVSQTTMFFLFCPKYIRLLVRIIDKKKVFMLTTTVDVCLKV